jgi:hypothetical protein
LEKSAKKRVKPGILPKITEPNREKTAIRGPEPRDHQVLSLAVCHGRLARFARPGRPTCPLTLLKFHAFSSADNDTLFHNEKPGAISARAFCTALDIGPLYTNHVTLSTNVEL